MSQPLRVCFLGTPEFAKVHLQTLLNDSRFKVVGVVTQPDRPSGRKMQLTPSEVKTLAAQNNLPVLTPENLRKEPQTLDVIKSWRADIAVVVAFGQILAQEFLDSFKFGAVNVHGSLLPLWRGAAPIQRALEAGDTVTGVALQKMVKKLDAGAVIGVRKIALDSKINATELYQKLAVLGCELLQKELLAFTEGSLIPVEQDEALVTFAPKIEKEEALLSFQEPALKLHNKVRAFSMGPGTYFMFAGKRLKVHETEVLTSNSQVPVGCVSEVSEVKLCIQTSHGQLSLKVVQPESKSKLPISTFLKAHALEKGQVLGGILV